MSQLTNSSHPITGHFTDVISSLCEIAELYYYLGKLDEAVAVLKTGLHLAFVKDVHPRDRVKLTLEYGRILIAHYFLTNRDFELVLTTVLDAKLLAEDAHYEQGKANALCLVGQAYYYNKLNTDEGDYKEISSYFQQAQELSEQLRDTRGLSEALFYNGLTYEQRGIFDKAHQYYTDALQFADLYNHKLEKSYALRHLAGLAQGQNDLDTALNYALASLSLREEIGFRRGLPFSHLLAGDIYQARKDPENALIHYQNAQALAEELGMKNALVFSLLAIGDNQLVQHDNVHAQANFQHAHTLAQELGIVHTIEEAAKRLHPSQE